MSSLLTLTASAFLAKLDGRTIILHFEGLHYTSSEVVPYHIARSNFWHLRQTAAEYVARYMTERHGGTRGSWPQLAQQFVPEPSSV